MERVFDLLEEEEERVKSSEDSQESSSSQSAASQVVKVEPAEPTVTVTARTNSSSKKQKTVRSLMDRMQGQVTDLTQPAENLKKEVQEYIGAMIRINQTPLQWWALHEVMYPNVARLAKQYLSIPPTEVNNNQIIKHDLYNFVQTLKA